MPEFSDLKNNVDQNSNEPLTIIVASPSTRELMKKAKRVASTEATILITGENGTGKDLLARWLHEHSSRKSGQYVKIDCGTLPESLFEAELFGYERGAFTGATTQKPGRFEAAQNGTLVLDEIAGLTTQIQAKLLRVIEERCFTRLGSHESKSLNARLIALTNLNLANAVEQNTFRSDLFYRLNVIMLEIPPLRERSEEIPHLMSYFVSSICKRYNKPTYSIDQEVIELLYNYDFPGNIRELVNIIERAILLSKEELVSINELPPYITSVASLVKRSKNKLTLAELEAFYIREVLRDTRGHKKRTAEVLGISRKNLYEKLRAYNIPYNQKTNLTEK